MLEELGVGLLHCRLLVVCFGLRIVWLLLASCDDSFSLLSYTGKILMVGGEWNQDPVTTASSLASAHNHSREHHDELGVDCLSVLN